MDCKVAVIGAGPAGSIAAEHSAKNYDTVVFEEHRKQLVHCAGLISKSGFERLGIRERDFIINRIRGARIFSPNGTCMEISPPETKAFVVDRSAFDDYLLSRAAGAGAEYVNSRVEIKGGEFFCNGKINAEKVILATGTNYAIQKKLNMGVPEFLVGAQYEVRGDFDPDFVELHFMHTDFFNWVIPLGDGYARIGTASRKYPLRHLSDFIRSRGLGNKIRNRVSGLIPIYNPRMRSRYGNIVLVGDAAAQVKATTGGGIVMGGIAAKYAWTDDYETRWRREIGRELLTHYIIRKFLWKMDGKGMEKILEIVNENKDAIERYGDMDFVIPLVSRMLYNPSSIAKIMALGVRATFLW